MKPVTFRNFTGGFLGGLLGILISYFVSPKLLPIGVIIGVIIGWHGKGLPSLVSEAWSKGLDACKTMYRRTRKVISLCEEGFLQWLAHGKVVPSLLVTFFLSLARLLINGILTLLSWFWIAIKAPVRFVRWFIEHPANRALAVDSIIALALLPVFLTGAWYYENSIRAMSANNDDFGFVIAISVWFGGAISRIVRQIANCNEDLYDMNKFYRDWETLDKFGTVGLYTLSTVRFFWHGILTAFFGIFTIIWASISLVLGTFLFIPISILVGVLRGTYHVFSFPSHLLCLATTLVVTTCSWFMYQNQFSDPAVVWVVALATGVISGGLTEVLRIVSNLFFSRSKVGNIFSDSHRTWQLLSMESGGYFHWLMEDLVFAPGLNTRVARILRSVCMGTPIAQPVKVV